MSIDGKGHSPSRQAQDRISALVSQNERLTGQVQEAEQTIHALRSRIAYLEGWKQSAEDGYEKERTA